MASAQCVDDRDFSLAVHGAQCVIEDENGSIAQEGAWTNVLTAGAVPVGLANLDLNALTPREWKQLRAELITTLRSGRDAAWEDAAQQVIYLAFYYRDKIKLAHTSAPLLDSYILDRSEQHRIMALAALHAIGDHDAMAHLAQRVRLEGSPRVRRLTVAALADHYGVRSYYDRATVTVGKPSVVTEGQPQKREGQ